VRKSWIVGALAAVLVLAGAAYFAFGPGSSATPEAPAPAAGQPAAEPAQPAGGGTVLADATVAVELGPDDHILGNPDAPITMIEYSSLSCPHCAAFHATVLPELKSEFIDKGQVRLVYRDFPLNWPALQAAQLIRCTSDNTRFYGLVETLFKLQEDWSTSSDVPASLAKIGALAGMDKATVDACLADESLKDKILAGRKEAEDKFKIGSTPTFVINGRVAKGVDMPALREMFKEMLPKG
jgi:protein-disulfide isomerase